jgi:hypothetical protein
MASVKRKEVGFDAEALVRSVEAFAAHVRGKQESALRTHQLSLPAPIKPPGPEDRDLKYQNDTQPKHEAGL